MTVLRTQQLIYDPKGRSDRRGQGATADIDGF